MSGRRFRLPARAGRAAVRERLRAMLPAADPDAGSEEPPSRRSLAMLLSLVVASVMWFSFSMRETYPLTLRLPIEIARTPDGQALRDAPPASAVVTLAGDGWTLLSLTRRRPTIRVVAERATVDLGAALRETGLPAGVAVQGVQPASIELALDTETRRTLPVRLVADIDTRPTHDLLRPPTLMPDVVEVTGAQSLLGQLDAWPTVPFEIENVDASFSRRIALADTFRGLLRPAVRSTVVSVEVGEFTEGSRELEIEVVNLPPSVVGVRFQPARVRAVYRAPAVGGTFDEARSTPAFRAVVDYADIRRDPSDGVVPVQARWPATLDVRQVELQPSRVEYFLQTAPEPAPEEE